MTANTHTHIHNKHTRPLVSPFLWPCARCERARKQIEVGDVCWCRCCYYRCRCQPLTADRRKLRNKQVGRRRIPLCVRCACFSRGGKGASSRKDYTNRYRCRAAAGAICIGTSPWDRATRTYTTSRPAAAAPTQRQTCAPNLGRRKRTGERKEKGDQFPVFLFFLLQAGERCRPKTYLLIR